MFLFALAQAATSAPTERAGPPSPSPCDLPRTTAKEIVVCGRREEPRSPYRLNLPASNETERTLPRAAIKIADGVTARAETDQADVGGFPSKRGMLRIKAGF